MNFLGNQTVQLNLN